MIPGSNGLKPRHEDVMARYRALGWIDRRRIDGLVAGLMLRSARFYGAALLLLVVQLLVLGCTWRWELAGWRRDLLRAAPALLALPWGIAVRRRAIGVILRTDGRNREEAHRHSDGSCR